MEISSEARLLLRDLCNFNKKETKYIEIEVALQVAHRRGYVQGFDDKHGTPCEQIRHAQEVNDLKELLAICEDYIRNRHNLGRQQRATKRLQIIGALLKQRLGV